MATRRGERYVQVTMVPQFDDDGAVQGLYVMVHDISERCEAELLQARSEERLSLALEGSGQSLFDWDIRANRIYCSAQASAFRGGPAVETTCDPAELRAYIHPDDIATVLARQNDALEGTARCTTPSTGCAPNPVTGSGCAAAGAWSSATPKVARCDSPEPMPTSASAKRPSSGCVTWLNWTS
jgi:hypothetical protein